MTEPWVPDSAADAGTVDRGTADPGTADPDSWQPVIDLAQALVWRPTAGTDAVHDVDSTAVETAAVETTAAEMVAGVMRGFGWQVTVEEVAPGRPNVIAVLDSGRPGRTLLFEGHLDVLSPGDADGWSFPPFYGDVVGGRLLGAGSGTSSGVAAMIHAARAAQLAGLDGRVIVALLADGPGRPGARHFARSDLAASGIDGVIVCEPSGGEICAVANGVLRLRIDLEGGRAHAGPPLDLSDVAGPRAVRPPSAANRLPPAGRNPLPAMGSVLMGLAELERQVAESVGRHPHLGNLSLSPTVLTAGDPARLGVIPASASVYLEVATVPGVGHRGLLHLITRLAEQIADDAGLTAGISVLVDLPPVDTPPDAAVVRALLDAHEAHTGEVAVFGGAPGSTDASILAAEGCLACVGYGPGLRRPAHRDEYVELADVLSAVGVYAAAARIFLGGGIR